MNDSKNRVPDSQDNGNEMGGSGIERMVQRAIAQQVADALRNI